MFGIIRDDIMKSQNKYNLKCLYDRVAPYADMKKQFDCNYDFLRLTEDETPMVNATIENVTERTTKELQKIAKLRAADFAPGAPSKPTNTPVLFDVQSQTVTQPASSQTILIPKPNYDLFNKDKN